MILKFSTRRFEGAANAPARWMCGVLDGDTDWQPAVAATKVGAMREMAVDLQCAADDLLRDAKREDDEIGRQLLNKLMEEIAAQKEIIEDLGTSHRRARGARTHIYTLVQVKDWLAKLGIKEPPHWVAPEDEEE